MSRVKQASKQKRTTKAAAVKVLGAAGLSFSLANSASASTMPTFGVPQSDNTSPNPRYVLSEEEMHDVSLATFYVFDRENVGGGMRLARGCGGGCGGGGGCRGGGGCGGFRGCGGGGGAGCRGCGGGCRGGGGWRRLPRWRRVRRLPWLRRWRVCWLPRLRRRLPWLRRRLWRWLLFRWLL